MSPSRVRADVGTGLGGVTGRHICDGSRQLADRLLIRSARWARPVRRPGDRSEERHATAARSVDCVVRTGYLPISVLTCRNSAHWCAVGGSIERRLAAKKRPAWPARPSGCKLQANARSGRARQVASVSTVAHASGCALCCCTFCCTDLTLTRQGNSVRLPSPRQLYWRWPIRPDAKSRCGLVLYTAEIW